MASGSRRSGGGGNKGIVANGDFNAGAVAVGDDARVDMHPGRGNTFNIGSHHTASTADPAALRAELQAMLRALDRALQSGAARRNDAAGRLATEAGQLVEAATRRNPDPSLLQHIGQKLKRIAPLLSGLPQAVKLTNHILDVVAKLHRLSF